MINVIDAGQMLRPSRRGAKGSQQRKLYNVNERLDSGKWKSPHCLNNYLLLFSDGKQMFEYSSGHTKEELIEWLNE